MEKSYEDLVREITIFNHLYSINEDELFEILFESKALLFDGHFELLSGLHTNTFFRFALIAQYPWMMNSISKEMLGWIKETKIGQIDVVLGTSRAGKWFAYDIARELNGFMKSRAVYSKNDPETGYPMTEILDGFNIKSKERILVVNDLTTTGTGVQYLVDLAESYNGNVVGICLFASRAQDLQIIKTIKEKYKFHSIIEFRMDSWDKKKCLLCKKMDLVKSIEINSLTSSIPINKVLEPLKSLRVA